MRFFGARYFGARYFAALYWSGSGATVQQYDVVATALFIPEMTTQIYVL